MEKPDVLSDVESPSHTRQCWKEGSVAVQLKDDGRYPSAQKLQSPEYKRFVEDCKNPPRPSDKFASIVRGAAGRKA